MTTAACTSPDDSNNLCVCFKPACASKVKAPSHAPHRAWHGFRKSVMIVELKRTGVLPTAPAGLRRLARLLQAQIWVRPPKLGAGVQRRERRYMSIRMQLQGFYFKSGTLTVKNSVLPNIYVKFSQIYASWTCASSFEVRGRYKNRRYFPRNKAAP